MEKKAHKSINVSDSQLYCDACGKKLPIGAKYYYVGVILCEKCMDKNIKKALMSRA